MCWLGLTDVQPKGLHQPPRDHSSFHLQFHTASEWSPPARITDITKPHSLKRHQEIRESITSLDTFQKSITKKSLHTLGHFISVCVGLFCSHLSVLCMSLITTKFLFETIIDNSPLSVSFKKLKRWSWLQLLFPNCFSSSCLHPFLSF